MPSDLTLQFEFVTPTNFIDTLRIHFRLARIARSARQAARRKEQTLASIAPHLRYDVGASDLPAEGGLACLLSRHPSVIAGSILWGQRPL